MIRFARDHDENQPMSVEVAEMPLYGIERAMGMDTELPAFGLAFVRFELYDDDGNLLYSGALSDDDEALNQTAALRCGETWAGATVVKVERDGRFVQEIG
jgi:hypothetical protein